VKDATCVEVCPVSCIHTTPESPQYYIDPEVCIACEQCVLVCPVKAIYLDADLPEGLAHYEQINADFFKQNKADVKVVTLAEAHAMIEAAEAFALQNNIKVAVALVDPAGQPVLTAAMEGVADETAKEALDKAYSSAVMHLPTEELRPNTALPAGFDAGRLVAEAGGFPMVEDISLFGAIGVAGSGEPELDVLCYQAGVAAFKVLRGQR
jgi:uncharacterized protein GlcG (DUF336 family)/NAD-dependent dihydropyrimidine dehydrogenase PreA subunit